MKKYLPSILRSMCALVIGILLIADPTTWTTWIVRIIGIIFVTSGIMPSVGFWMSSVNKGTSMRPIFPIVGLGSILLGLMLFIWPDVFIKALMYLLGFILLLAGFNQLFSLVGNRTVAPLCWWVFIIPILLLGSGGYIFLHPMNSASLPFVILGVASITYALSSFFYTARNAWFEHKANAFTPYEEVK